MFFIKGPFEAKRMSDNKVFEAITISELSSITKISKNTLVTILKSDKPLIKNDFICRTKSLSEWPDSAIEIKYFKPRNIEVKNISTGIIEKFQSFRKAYKFLNCDKKTLKNRLTNNKPLNGYEIKEIINPIY